MKDAALVIIKPDGIVKGLVGKVIEKFDQPELQIVALRIVKITRDDAKEHYKHLNKKPFFNETVSYFCGEYHKNNKLIFLIYYGDNAIRRCRKIAGATNPEKATPHSIRGAYGRITTKGIYENVVHVSSDQKEAEREIKLWFKPEDILIPLYPSQYL